MIPNALILWLLILSSSELVLLSFLKDIAMRYDYDYIGLESTNDNSSAFAEHFNFKDLGDKWNYLISIKEFHIP